MNAKSFPLASCTMVDPVWEQWVMAATLSPQGTDDETLCNKIFNKVTTFNVVHWAFQSNMMSFKMPPLILVLVDRLLWWQSIISTTEPRLVLILKQASCDTYYTSQACELFNFIDRTICQCNSLWVAFSKSIKLTYNEEFHSIDCSTMILTVMIWSLPDLCCLKPACSSRNLLSNASFSLSSIILLSTLPAVTNPQPVYFLGGF